MVQTIVDSDRIALEEQAANIIQSEIAELLQMQDKVTLALPGGRSVHGIFEKLQQKDIDWSKVHIFVVDERLVPIDDDESNYKLINKHLVHDLLKQKKIPEENIHPFVFDKKAADFGTAAYQSELEATGHGYDIVLLSAGEDGHVGALFPNHGSLSSESVYFVTMDDSPKPPAERMTASKTLLQTAEVAIVLFFGDSKNEAFKHFMNKSMSIEDCPAKLAYGVNKAYALTDQEI